MTRAAAVVSTAAFLALSSAALARPPGEAQAPARPPAFRIENLAPRPSLGLYLVIGEEPVVARLVVRQGARPEGDRLMVRAFDPAERLTFWQYVEAGQAPQPFLPGSVELWGIPLQYSLDAKPGDLMLDADIRLEGAGVHQVRVVAGAHNALVTLELPRELPYGVSFQNGDFAAWKNPPGTMYAYIPPRAEELHVAGGPLRLFDEEGNRLADTGADRQAVTAIRVPRADAVWRVEFPRPGQWAFNAWNLPFLLCSTAEAARTIRASIEELPDGTVVSHKFQRRIAGLLPRLLAPGNVGDTRELIVPLSSRREAWLRDPRRNLHLLNAYGPFVGLEPALHQQNLDPDCHWSGALGVGVDGARAGWYDFIERPEPENRWDRWKELPGLWGGLSPRDCTASIALAFAPTFDSPVNPYYGRRELLYRSAAAALRDLMSIGEDELLPWGRGLAYGSGFPYPGFMAFILGQKVLPVYAMVAPHMPGDVQEAWTEAVRRLVDRTYPDMLVSARNQSSHYLVVYQEFFEGSGIARYQDLARAYARRFIQGLHPAGWAEESKGPDATYNGMTHWHMAVYYRKSGDEAMADALRKSYRFFNHTVAPEPDGGRAGASNFSHRTLGGFHMEQYRGARGIADHLPEVGLWAAPEPSEAEREREDRELAESIERALDRLPKPKNVEIASPWHLYSTDRPNRAGVWPALEEAPFLRDFAGELVAVRRPGYYAAVYVGQPASPWYIRNRERSREPVANDAENRGGDAIPERATPYLGGGLSLLATPEYGNALLAMNWAPTTHHGLIATREDGARHWADYHSTDYRLDEEAGTLVVTGRIEGLPLNYLRSYRFLDHAVEVRLTISADGDIRLADLVENLPVAGGDLKARGVALSVAGAKPEAGSDWTAGARGAQIRDGRGAGLDIAFRSPQTARAQPHGLAYRGIQIGRIEIKLPTEWSAGQRVELAYRLVPAAPAGP